MKKKPAAESVESIESLRAYYHSVHDSERADVIELLGSMKEPDAARELISLYDDSQWRSTRLQIIRALSQNPGQRGLEFLFRLTQEQVDIPIAQAALWSLGQTHEISAARFLVHFYKNCGDFLKPSVVGALGQIPDRTLAREFLEELPRALKAQQADLVKNLVLTLGELKAKEALPLLVTLAGDRAQASTALSALVAIGKIARDPRLLDALERRFQDDLFEYQLFTSVKTQIQFRSQWSLEDYLTRIFDKPTFHRTLPFELSHFKAEDVREGLRLFAGSQHHAKLCLALGKIDFPGIAAWYSELIDMSSLDTPDLFLLLDSLACHFDSGMREPLAKISNLPACAEAEVLLLWLSAVAKALPEAEVEFRTFFASERFRGLSESQRIEAVNHLISFGLSVQTNGAQLQNVGRLLEGLLEQESAQAMQGRALRGLGHLGINSKKGLSFAREHAAREALASSSFNYLEQCPESSALPTLLKLLEENAAPLSVSLLKCLTAQAALPQDHGGLTISLRASLAPKIATEVRLEALRLLGRHPRKEFIPDVTACLKGDERIALAAVIALKGFAAVATVPPSCDLIADALAPHLHSKQGSLAGRALDTLTSLPGLRAKRLVIDFLKERSDDPDVCDKIIRCLGAPENGSEYFVAIVDEILKRSPQHSQLDGLIQLREKLDSGTSSLRANSLMAAKGVDITAIDRELTGKIAGYEDFDEVAKSVLRSAELPFRHPEMFDEYVDKSSSLVGYCKAVDILLEKTLGRKHLFPKLENHLHEFQSALHLAGLGEDFPSSDRVLKQMGLEKHFNSSSLPLHKMVMMAQGIRSGRIVNERFKTLDGLRAWAAMLLVFGRKIQGGKPLVSIKSLSDDQVASFCKRLIALQEVRNPAAHRQTVVQFTTIDETRAEVFGLLNLLQKMF